MIRALTGSVSRWVTSVVTALALAACTGTTENTVPTLLVIGSVAPGGSQLELVQDVYEPGTATPRDLVRIAGSTTPLTAPPVSLDVVDRNGVRNELVVLTQDPDTAKAELHFFDLSGLDTTAGAPLVSSRASVDLSALLANEGISPLCPVEVAVGSDGRRAALLDDGSCRDGVADIFVLDLVTSELFVLTREFIVDVLPAGLFVDQSTDLLFFPAQSLNRVEVLSIPLTGATQTTTVGNADLSADAAGDNDFDPVAGGLGVLVDDRLALVQVGDDIDEASSVATLSGASMLLPDPGGSLDEIVVLSASQVAIHASAEDEDPEIFSLSQSPVDATLEPVQRFGYVLEAGGVDILDLFPYADEPASRVLFRELPGMDDPRVITWTHAEGTTP